MSPDDVPLICDSPPGPMWVLETDHRLSREEAQRIIYNWNQAVVNGGNATNAILLAWGLTVRLLPGRYEWPDSEFCAA